MSEQWKGLHYHDRHVTAARLGRTIVVCELGMACREVCSEAYPCKCCLTAEVEVLRAQVDAVRELHRSCLTLSVDLGGCMLDEHDADAGNPSVCLHDNEDYPCPTIRILDGGDA